MESEEEHDLINEIRATGHYDVANAVANVLNKRDSRFFEVTERIAENNDLLRGIGAALEKHVEEEHEMLKKFLGAFPEEDTRAHRDAHQAWIERERKRAALRDAIIEKSLASLVWMGLVALGIAVWHYLGDHFRTR